MGSLVAADEGVVVEVEADEVIGSDFSADSNGTRRFALTDEEREGLAKLFDSVDVDGSGGVDYLELASFLRAMSELDDDLGPSIRHFEWRWGCANVSCHACVELRSFAANTRRPDQPHRP